MTDYKAAGVDIHEGYRTVEKIRDHAGRTMKPDVLSVLGSFGAFMRIPAGYKSPVLVSGTDGVGTKLKIAFALGRYDTIGIDAVAMCVNDILCHGAEPMFFLDYLACGHLEAEVAADIVKGVADGCILGDLALVGGETAEMPGFYQGGEYDIAGFCVGVCEESEIIDGRAIGAGDILIGLPSSGFHSNGYSLVRRLFTDLTEPWEGRTMGEALLEPTRIYVHSVRAVLKEVAIHGMAHITGGGFIENIPRMFADDRFKAVIHRDSYEVPALFKEAIRRGADEASVYNTFNMGIGFVLCVAPADLARTLEILAANGEAPVLLGEVAGRGETEEAIWLV